MTNLQELCGRRYRVQDDGTDDQHREERPWCQEIPGRHGCIYPYGINGSLAVFLNSSRMIARAQQLGMKQVRSGDGEAVFVLEPSSLDQAAELIHAYRRRQLTPEQQADLAKRIRGTSRPDSEPV